MKTIRYKILLLRFAIAMLGFGRQKLKHMVVYSAVALWSIVKH